MSGDAMMWLAFPFTDLVNLDSEIRQFKPGEIRNFEVVVQDGAKEGYDISVSIY
jgi:hypothetical protein